MGVIDIPDYPVDLLVPAKQEPWPNDDLGPLTKSIKAKGVLNPLVVVDLSQDQTYTVADGNRRLRVLRELGIRTVPIRVADDLPSLLANLPSFGGADPSGVSVPYWKRELAFAGVYRFVILEVARKHLGLNRSKNQMGRKTPLPGFGFRKMIDDHFGLRLSKLSRLSAVAALLDKAPEPDRPEILRRIVTRINNGEIRGEQVYEQFRSFGTVAHRMNGLGAKVEDDQVVRMVNTLKVVNSFLADVAIGDLSGVADETKKKFSDSVRTLQASARRVLKVIAQEKE